MQNRAPLLVVAVLLWACADGVAGQGDSISESGVYFPRHAVGPNDDQATGIAEGLLTLRAGCIWIDLPQGEEHFLAVWPPSSRLRRTDGGLEIHDATTFRTALVGTQVRVGGGERDSREIGRLTGQEAPPGCRGQKAWLVTKILGPP